MLAPPQISSLQSDPLLLPAVKLINSFPLSSEWIEHFWVLLYLVCVPLSFTSCPPNTCLLPSHTRSFLSEQTSFSSLKTSPSPTHFSGGAEALLWRSLQDHPISPTHVHQQHPVLPLAEHLAYHQTLITCLINFIPPPRPGVLNIIDITNLFSIVVRSVISFLKQYF